MFVPHAIGADDRIIYNHIPKTAGTSVNHYFRCLLGRKAVGWLGIDFTTEELEAGNGLERFRVIGGHFRRRQASELPFPAIYLSAVREPISRVVSYHRHILNMPGHRMHEKLSGSLAVDLAGAFGQHIANQQCSFLGRKSTSASACRTASDNRTGIALVEDLDVLLHRITRMMGMEPIPLPVEHVSRGAAPSVNSKAKELLSGLLVEDINLYEELRRRYDSSSAEVCEHM